MNGAQTLAEALIDAVPALQAPWDEYVAGEEYEPGHPYTDASALANAIVLLWRNGGDDGIRAVQEKLEELLLHARGQDRAVIIVGLIEDLQNSLLRNGEDLDEWADRLGPATREAWISVSDLWAGHMTAEDFNRFVEAGPAETKSQRS